MVIIKQGQMDAWVSFKRGEKKKNLNKAPLVSCRRGVSAFTSLFISSAAGVRECFAHESVF